MIRIVLEIPDEFERDFYNDYFKGSIQRVIHDIITTANHQGHYDLAGNYEIEVLEMLMKALINGESYELKSTGKYLKGFNDAFGEIRKLTKYKNIDATMIKLCLSSYYGIQGVQYDKDSENKDR